MLKGRSDRRMESVIISMRETRSGGNLWARNLKVKGEVGGLMDRW
jgi:cytoskeletal protein CcmA (bactofilin family)